MRRPKTSDSNTQPASETRSTSSNESSERSPKQADEGVNAAGVGWVRVVGFLLVAAAYTPLRGYLGNIDKFPHPERLVFIAFIYLALGFGWFVLLERMGIRKEASLVSSLVFVLLASSGGALAESMSTLVGIWICLGVAIAAALLINRMPGELGEFLALGALAFLLVGLIMSWPGTERSPQSLAPTASSSIPATLRVSPDVFLIVLDGFPGDRSVQEIYGSRIDYVGRDSVLRRQAWSSYPMTIASITSLLDMGYPLDGGDVVDAVSSGPLADAMSGQNRFTQILADSGYRITYVESGYSRSYCADIVDVCIESSFLDEGTHWILAQSVMGMELRKRTGSAFTQGALHTMNWMRDHVEPIATNGQPDFVFANVLAPHPPLLLNADCDVVFEYWRVGNSVYAGDEIVDERQKALIDQARCVADFEDDIFMTAPDDAVLIFVSDHGGDSLGQMSKAGHSWDRLDIVERLSVHFAARTPMECTFGQDVMLPEVLRVLLWCLAGTEPNIQHVEQKMFIASRIEGTINYELDELTSKEIQSVRASSG